MFPAARLNLLCQRKQELLATSEVKRRLFAVECAGIQQRLEWLDRIVSVTRRVRPFIFLLAPLLVVWTGQHKNGGPSWIGTIASALPMAGRVASAVQQFVHR